MKTGRGLLQWAGARCPFRPMETPTHAPTSHPRVLALLVAFALAFSGVDAAPAGADTSRSARASAPAAAGDPFRPGVWRLTGNDPAAPLDDLEPLKQLIGKATVVGLGETIHTSGGYYRMKHRLFRFLVERAGFRVDFPGADEPLLEPGVTYNLGARNMVPREHFDVLVYVETSPAMTPTRWAPCQ